jgi:hypothetical protein
MTDAVTSDTHEASSPGNGADTEKDLLIKGIVTVGVVRVAAALAPK